MKINKLLGRLTGHEIRKLQHTSVIQGIEARDLEIINYVSDRTMTSPIRLLNAISSAKYVAANQISGSIVECGVWRGGTCMAMAMALTQMKVYDYDFYLFDTFTGMTSPSHFDRRLEDGRSARDLGWKASDSTLDAVQYVEGVSAYASLEDVLEGMLSTAYPADRIHLVKGDILQTMPDETPEKISILRLDTDWYESTLHELQVGWPRLSTNGVLIIDDYDYWDGARRAVDVYFRDCDPQPLLVRMDEGRLAMKTGPKLH